MDERAILDARGFVLQSDINHSNVIDISHLPAGIYFLRLASDEVFGIRMFVKASP